jgi:hypothetical protein
MNDSVPTASRHATTSLSASSVTTGGVGAERGVSAESGRVGTLRGATVSFNPRRLVQVAVGVVMATLVVTAIVLTVAGIHSNDQINRLQTQGQPVTVTVTGCLGLLGGSGSNAAGYSCNGSYQLAGHVYRETLPGSTFYRPGTKLVSIAVPGDPALVSPVAIVNSQHASNGVFVVPIVLGGILLAFIGVLVLRNRPGRRTSTAPQVSAAL